MATDLEDLYKEVILDHRNRPRNQGMLDVPPARHARGYNPLCGDEVDVYVDVDDNGRVEAVAVESHGCAISTASASMMTEVVKGKTRQDVDSAHALFRSMLGLDDEASFRTDLEPGRQLGDAEALQGVRQFPSRIKCATLAWAALKEALDAPPGVSA